MSVQLVATGITFPDATTQTTAATGGVTSLNGQTGAITNTTYGSIGSYVIAFGAANTLYAAGGTIAGSSLVNFNTASYGGFNYFGDGTSTGGSGGFYPFSTGGATYASLSLSGTWRAMTGGKGTPTGGARQCHLWVRIS